MKSKPPTPKPLKKNSKNLSSSSLYASSPALSLQQQLKTEQEEVPKNSVSTSRLKSVRNFFRNKFNFNNKTANKTTIISSPVVALSKNIETNETTTSMIVLDTDEK